MFTNFNAGMRGRSVLYLIAGIAIGTVLLLAAVRGIRWPDIRDRISSADLVLVFLAFMLMTAGSFARSLRWRILLSADRPIGVAPVFWATMVGYLGNNLLPMRAGEVLRSALLGSAAGLSKSFCLACTLSERALDTLILMVVLLFGITSTEIVPQSVATRLRWMAFLLVACAVIAGLFNRSLRVHGRRLQWIVWPGFRIIAPYAQSFWNGVASIFQGRRAVKAVALSATAWVVDSIAGVVLARALRIELGVEQMLVFLAFLGVASALPSAPGYVGTFQFVAVTVLPPFGLTRMDAIAFILVFQAVVCSSALVWGLIGFFRLVLTFTPPNLPSQGVSGLQLRTTGAAQEKN